MSLYLEDPKPILYLDDDTAGATEYFLKFVKKAHLHPVNFSDSACESIQRLTGVRATCTDIHEYLFKEERRFGVVWLDLMCRTVDHATMSNSLSSCDYLFLTLSTRGSHPGTVVQDACDLVRRCGGAILERPV
ncbi:MAG: hypothetical protein VXW74_01790, partial [Candidatus Thermoplasmatota archaeon]|nr:hypothetical protein [Candidatus Thermoplasmatota archaeon]